MKRPYKIGIAAAAGLIILFLPVIPMTLMCYVNDDPDKTAIPETNLISLTDYLKYWANGERHVFDRDIPQRGGEEVRITVACEPEHIIFMISELPGTPCT